MAQEFCNSSLHNNAIIFCSVRDMQEKSDDDRWWVSLDIAVNRFICYGQEIMMFFFLWNIKWLNISYGSQALVSQIELHQWLSLVIFLWLPIDKEWWFCLHL